MAATEAGVRLTEAHRIAQGRVGIETVQQMVVLSRLLDPTNLDGTVEAWLRLAVPLVSRQNARSAGLARRYYRAFRFAELGDTDYSPTVRLTADAERVIASLTATGPATIKARTGQGLPLEEAFERGVVRSAGAAQRIALDGGRSTVAANTTADPQARGWRRVTGPNPCDFCSEIAARGTVYTESTADFSAHDFCQCEAEPALGGDRRQVQPFVRADLSEEAREARNAAIRRWLA